MSLVHKCDDCGARIMLSKRGFTKFDAPPKGLIEETAPGRPMMPDSMRLVVYDGSVPHVRIMPRNARAMYLNIHRCGRP